MSGIRVLLEGGNAVNAAVAVGSTLNVVEPFMSGAAGIGLMLISRARTRERHVLDFIGPAPRGADPARCTEDELAGGPKSCATPGNLGGWLTALERFGSMPRQKVLAPAIDLAENGVPLTFANVKFFEQSRAHRQEHVFRMMAHRVEDGQSRPRAGSLEPGEHRRLNYCESDEQTHGDQGYAHKKRNAPAPRQQRLLWELGNLSEHERRQQQSCRHSDLRPAPVEAPPA